MVQRPKLELEVNKPTTMKILFDDPITGQSRYGSYALYAVEIDGHEYSFFLNEQVHEEMKELQKGDVVTITKLAAQRGNKLVTTYDVSLPKNKNGSKSNGNTSRETGANTKDDLFEIMLHSYKDAIEIQNQLNGMADPTRIAITLFIARSKTTSLNGNGNY